MMFASKQTFFTHSLNKLLALFFKLDTIQPKLLYLGLLITFVNNFHFNLVVMFVHFVNQSSVINSIYSKQLVLLYRKEQISLPFVQIVN
jgi:hypothetical protein